MCAFCVCCAQVALLLTSNALPVLIENVLTTPSAVDLDRPLCDLFEAVLSHGLGADVLPTSQHFVRAAFVAILMRQTGQVRPQVIETEVKAAREALIKQQKLGDALGID